MLTAIAVAGGFTYRGVQDYAGLVRTERGAVIEGRVEPGSLILPGDVVRRSSGGSDPPSRSPRPRWCGRDAARPAARRTSGLLTFL